MLRKDILYQATHYPEKKFIAIFNTFYILHSLHSVVLFRSAISCPVQSLKSSPQFHRGLPFPLHPLTLPWIIVAANECSFLIWCPKHFSFRFVMISTRPGISLCPNASFTFSLTYSLVFFCSRVCVAFHLKCPNFCLTFIIQCPAFAAIK